MINYAVVQIAGKQYKVEPGKELRVNLVEGKSLEAQVLAQMEDGKLTVGTPFLKTNLKFDVLGEVKGEKIRVAKFHAKANYRRVKGAKARYSTIKLAA